MKLKHFSLIFSIIGILVLYFLSELSHIPLIEISEMPKYEGKQATIQGIVTNYYMTRHGTQIISIKEENSTAEVFVEGGIDVEYGDIIKATGEIQKYQDKWELIINDKRFVKILEKWNNISFPLWQLAENPSKYLNLNVNVTGYVESISNAYFYLVDIENKHTLIVFYKIPKNLSIYPGQRVSVSGRFSFDKENFRYQLDLFDVNHELITIPQE